MSTSVIGLTTYREVARWGVWDQRADLLPAQYAEAVVACGGVPVLLPPVATTGAADTAVERVDGLVISGGAVFATGSITFCGSLLYRECNNGVSRMLDNVLRRWATG